MKKIFVSLLVAILAVQSVPAQTNGPGALLQKGLFEEEANRNLDAAIQAYQDTIKLTRHDHQIAATAVYHLGECYRRQGKTNEANVQFQRIEKEFSDQLDLVQLSHEQQRLMFGENASVQTPPQQEPIAELNQDPVVNLNGEMRQKAFQEQVRIQQENRMAREESEEIEKVGAIIKDNPDLINSKDGWPFPAMGSEAPPLIHAINYNRPRLASFLLKNHANTEVRDRMGMTPLILAVASYDTNMVDLLLKTGADVNDPSQDGYKKTPLHYAAANGNRDLMEKLLACHANVNARDFTGEMPLHIAALKGFKAIVELLLASSADINAHKGDGGTPLELAVSAGNKATAELLVEHHADVNTSRTSQRPGGSLTTGGMTPLMEMVVKGDGSMTKFLLTHGANISAVNADGETALHLAAMAGKLEVIKLLLEHGAEVNARDSQGKTPLHLCAQTSGNPRSIAGFLLDHQADPNALDDAKKTPVLTAVLCNSTDTLKSLLDHKANPSTPDAVGNFPLLVAINFDRQDTVTLLVDHGANVNAAANGLTALHEAANRLQKGIVELLLAHGANVNAQTASGSTPLDMIRNNASPVAVEIRKLLRDGGGFTVEEIGTIRIARMGGTDSHIVFNKNVFLENRFTLFETIATLYTTPLNRNPVNGNDWSPGIAFPDFSRVVIKRRGTNGETLDLKIDLESALVKGDCSGDKVLQWGDIVEIPTVDHEIDKNWSGLTEKEKQTLAACLTRKVNVIVKGQVRTIVLKSILAPEEPSVRVLNLTESSAPLPADTEEKVLRSFWLWSVLSDSGVLLASSDPSRITVKRATPNGTVTLIHFDSSKESAGDVWLRAGDVIEIPEKP